MKYLLIFLILLLPAVANARSVDFKLKINDYGKTGTVIIRSSLLEKSISLDNLEIRRKTVIINFDNKKIPISFTPMPGQLLEITIKKL